MMKDFSILKRNLKKDFSNLKILSVAILGDSATQFLVQALRAKGHDYGLDLRIWEADFNQIERQIFDPSSELYAQNPDAIILFQSTHKLLGKYNKIKTDECLSFASSQLQLTNSAVEAINEKLAAKIIFYNYPEIDDSVFGNYSNKTEASFLFQLRKLNYELMQFSVKYSNFYLCDLSSIQNQVGKTTMFHSSVYINTEMVLNLDVLPAVAARTLDLLASLNGQFKKCVIVDLDNTLWGGIIGDDGIENIQLGTLGIGKAFTEFQYWIKKLKNRQVILNKCKVN